MATKINTRKKLKDFLHQNQIFCIRHNCVGLYQDCSILQGQNLHKYNYYIFFCISVMVDKIHEIFLLLIQIAGERSSAQQRKKSSQFRNEFSCETQQIYEVFVEVFHEHENHVTGEVSGVNLLLLSNIQIFFNHSYLLLYFLAIVSGRVCRPSTFSLNSTSS